MLYEIIGVIGALIVFGSFLYVLWVVWRSLKQ